MPATFSGISSLSLSRSNNSGCSFPLQYSEGLCYTSLRDIKSQNCHINDSDVVLVATNNESMTRTAINYLNQLNPSPECSQIILPFLCLYLFGLCGDGGQLIQPTLDQCEEIQFRICAREWTLAASFGMDFLDCKMLPMEQNISCPSRNESRESSMLLTCQKDFFLDVELQFCVASCQTWSQFGEVNTTAIRVIVLTSSFIGILLAIIALVVSFIRHKAMFDFPSIFLVYITIDLLVLDFVIVLGQNDANLFCSSPSILNNTVTPFCVLSGIVFSYTNIQLGLWWVFHLSVLLWSVWFPFHYQKYKSDGKLKYIHIIFSLTGIFLPTLSIIGTMSEFAISVKGYQDREFLSGGLGFTPFTYPPIFCVPSTVDSGFYAFILPVDLIIAIGGPILIFILYGFYKKHKLIGAAEVKLMLVLSYYILLTAFGIVTFTLALKNDDAIFDAIDDYFLCEGQGVNHNSPCRRSFEQYNSPVVLALSLSILSLYPLYVLIFVVNIRELKQACTKIITTKTMKATIITLN